MKNTFFALATFVLACAMATACGHHHDHHHDGEIVRIEVVDRGQTDQPVVATWTKDGWTGELPVVSLASTNKRISLGIKAIADDGDDLIAHDDLEARYALASGAPTGIIDVERDDIFHGDHIHVYGVAAGVTQIRVLIWHDDHADLETDPIAISVVD